MNTTMIPALLGISCILLALIGATGMMITRAQTESKRVKERLREVTGAHARQPIMQIRSIARAAAPRKITLTHRLTSLFGFDPVRAKYHPVPAWLVLILTLAAARGMAWAVQGVFGDLVLISVPVVWVVLSRTVFGTMTARRTNQLLVHFPDALSMIVRAVRVGMPVSEAMRLVGREAPQPTAGEFEKIANELAIGTSLEDAIKALAERTGIPDYQFFATALSLQAQTGGGLTETLEGLADVIRKRLALRAKGIATASEARTSAIVLAALPFVTFAMMYVINRPYMSLLYTTDFGKKLIGIAFASLVIGVLTMRSIIRRSLA